MTTITGIYKAYATRPGNVNFLLLRNLEIVDRSLIKYLSAGLQLGFRTVHKPP